MRAPRREGSRSDLLYITYIIGVPGAGVASDAASLSPLRSDSNAVAMICAYRRTRVTAGLSAHAEARHRRRGRSKDSGEVPSAYPAAVKRVVESPLAEEGRQHLGRQRRFTVVRSHVLMLLAFTRMTAHRNAWMYTIGGTLVDKAGHSGRRDRRSAATPMSAPTTLAAGRWFGGC